MRENTLEQLKNVDIRTVDPDTLVDLRDIHINPCHSKEERMMEFVRQVKNPYCFRVGEVAVKVSYSDTTATLEDRLESLMRKL